MAGDRTFSYVRIWLAAGACMGLAPAWGAGADEGLRQAFERARYSLEDSGRGTYMGENLAQRLTLEFNEQGARLIHPDGSVNFHLTGYGYGERLRTPASAEPTVAGNRVEYRRGDLTEWYVNGAQGLEQGFTLAKRPGTAGEGELLAIALGVAGELAPKLKADAVLFESSKGVVLRYAGLKASDARGRVLSSRLEVRGGEIRLMVEDRGAQYPLVVDPTWTQQQKLTASDGTVNGAFGASVSLSGDTAVIGVPRKNSSQGAAHVFVRSGGVWSPQENLTALDGAANDNFGLSASVSGDTVVIGAFSKNSNQGTAYAFVRSGGVWSQQQKLTALDGAVGDSFGFSASVSGDTAVIGAYSKNRLQGAAYVFVRSGVVWSQQQKLTASDNQVNDFFGYAVSVSGDTAVIGAFNKNGGQGAAYVFVRSGVVWSQQQKLTASDGAGFDSFGQAVSVSGDTVVIGAPDNNTSQGAAYAFVRSAGVWGQQRKFTALDGAPNDHFGAAVSVGGDAVVVGARGKNSNQGVAYLFVRRGVVWSQQQELTDSDGVSLDSFGQSVSVSGDAAVIGAFNKNGGQGAAYVFVPTRLGTNALLFGSAAGTSSVVLTYNAGWTATANDSFLHISAGSASGTGNGLVVFTYDAFAGTGTRTGTLTIAGLTVTVTQAGTNYVPVTAMTTLVSTGLNSPLGIAVDHSGNLYIADTSNGAIKEWIASTQQITTLVSLGLIFPTGVAVDGFGNAYIADDGSGAIKEWSASTQQTTTLPPLGLRPAGVAVDGSGNVYIADVDNNAIKEWSASTQQISTLVSSGLTTPTGVAVDGTGNVYIADYGNGAIREWIGSTQQTTTLASVGLSPAGVAVDGSGNVYIADYGNSAIKEWIASTQQVTTLVSSGLRNPAGVAVDGSGGVYIADSGANAIEVIPYAFVGPSSLTEPPAAGADSLLPVLPSTTSLAGIFAPTSDQGWLTIGAIANGVIHFSFTANASTSARTGHITVLGQQIAVTQDGLAGQTITFGALANQPFGTAPFAVSANASSGLAVSFASTTSSVCTVSGATVTLVAVGTCTIQATQAGNAGYAAATPVNQSFQVTQESQTIAFSGLAAQLFGTAPFPATATATSGLTVSLNSQTTLVCTVSGVTVTLVSAGACTIQATQAGNTNFAAATPVSQSFQVLPGDQAIKFGGPSNQAFGTAPFTVSATATSGLTVSFNSKTTPVCTVSGSTVTLVSVGTCTIQATQAGNDNYSAAKPVSQSFQVTQETQTISFGALSNQALGVAPFAVSATASSGYPVSFASTTSAVCTVSVATVTLASAGTCTIQATQPGDSNCAAAPPVNQSFQVTLVQYLLTTQTNSSAMGTISPGSGMVNGGSTVSVDATANAGFIFTGFSGALSGATHPQNLTVNAPATVTANFQPGPTSLGGSFGAKSGPQSARVWTVNIGNNGPGAAMGAKVTAFTVQQTLGAACTPTVSSAMPVVAGDIAPGGTQPALVTVNFTGCAANAFFKVTANVSANNGAASGTILRMNQLQ